jgi:hypothetical protein
MQRTHRRRLAGCIRVACQGHLLQDLLVWPVSSAATYTPFNTPTCSCLQMQQQCRRRTPSQPPHSYRRGQRTTVSSTLMQLQSAAALCTSSSSKDGGISD